ncbi:hypothetical protein NLJ89_g4421 [Agrocybe chaxingu]|uniref:Uncharacterized protein n=1 Tax=Agrocybe chaxingu TaxID=84603 RepID=A0A9W8K2Z3_9AGAR|nr:hypothetical protein NLJ89_g4421 [Agrocybe chaxingu]
MDNSSIVDVQEGFLKAVTRFPRRTVYAIKYHVGLNLQLRKKRIEKRLARALALVVNLKELTIYWAGIDEVLQGCEF